MGRRRPEVHPAVLAAAVSALDLVFLVAIALAMAFTPLLYGVPWWLVALLIVPNVAVVATAALVVFCVLVFRRRYFTAWGRGQYVATTLASVAFVWFCAEWNLLGMKV